MRMVHTSDWHIGRSICDVSLLEDQAFFLDRLCEALAEVGADALLISGDLYDRSIPPAEAVVLMDEALHRIVSELGIPVLAIAGNHDGASRLGFGARLLRKGGLALVPKYHGRLECVTLRDTHGPVNVYLLPYLSLEPTRLLLREEITTEKTISDLFSLVIRREAGRFDPKERNVLLAHGFFAGAGAAPSLTESETAVGGSDAVDLSPAAFFDYIALGHLHRAQSAGMPHARYSGSPLPYSLSEAGASKSVTLVELGEKGQPPEISPLSLPALRNLRALSGTLEEILAAGRKDPAAGDYVYATLTDPGVIPDAMNRLRSLYPNALGLKFEVLERENRLLGERAVRSGLSVEALFAEFYREVKGAAISEREGALVRGTLETIHREEGDR